MTRYVLGVSGGVDSVVLLDALMRDRLDVWHSLPRGEVVVAHFDHGIRPDSAADAAFVGQLAHSYGCSFEQLREELGLGASEELARRRRYAFLYSVCEKYNAQLMTAHHADDVVETVVINLARGTGWRGLAVLGAEHITRPFLGVTKRTLLEYAATHALKWREDSTNQDQHYFRNRVRTQLRRVDEETKEWVRELRDRQLDLRREIDTEAHWLVGKAPYSRYFFTHIYDTVALELLRTVFLNETAHSPTIPQRQRALHAIKVARPGTVYDVGEGTKLRFTRREFVVE